MTYLPARARKCNTRHEGIIEIRNIDPEVVKRHAFRPGLVSQALHRVKLLQWRIARAIYESKDEDERNHRLRLTRSLDHRCVRIGINYITPIGMVLQIGRNEPTHNGEDDDQDASGNEELRSPPPFIRIHGAENCTRKGNHVLHAIVEEAHFVI
jgi:hypothetical protein